MQRPRTRGTVFWLGLAGTIYFSIRDSQKLGPNLRALICGSAPLARDTQLFFMMLGIPVLQVYGLTETTAILHRWTIRAHIDPDASANLQFPALR